MEATPLPAEKRPSPFNAALQLSGFPAGTTALLPCPVKCGCCPMPSGFVAASCAACSTAIARPEISIALPDLTAACWKCLRAAWTVAKQMAGAPQ